MPSLLFCIVGCWMAASERVAKTRFQCAALTCDFDGDVIALNTNYPDAIKLLPCGNHLGRGAIDRDQGFVTEGAADADRSAGMRPRGPAGKA